MVYKVVTKTGRGLWLKRKLCLGPAGVINCTPLSAASFGVSLFLESMSTTSSGQLIKNGKQVAELLDATLLPRTDTAEAKGNSSADHTAKAAASQIISDQLTAAFPVSLPVTLLTCDKDFREQHQTRKKKGGRFNSKRELWVGPNGRPILPFGAQYTVSQYIYKLLQPR